MNLIEKAVRPLKDDAIALLNSLPDSVYKTSLIDLVNFTVERKY